MEFNRRSLATLRQVKRLAKEHAGFQIHFDSVTLEDDLMKLLNVSKDQELRTLLMELLIEDGANIELEEQYVSEASRRVYRGSEVLVESRNNELANKMRRYRGQLVSV
ncbi:MAG: hypothetical protein P1U57_02675 [Oleibacter sp.]|nr:hypothetical protein [Thalassolituus sp.]